nr:TMV resistance protein N-like [Tanacetum cinerariifolium]
MGDFNEVHDNSERFGSVFNKQGAKAFNSFISNAGLVEVSLGGCSFMWCHKSATKMSKLDRFFIFDNLICSCPSISSTSLDRLNKWSSNSRKRNLKAELDDLDLVIDKGEGADVDVKRRQEVVSLLQEAKKVDSIITTDENEDLKREVYKEEIKRAVWDCGIDKAPVPDGFTFGFYRRYWNLIESDVVDAVKWFFQEGTIMKGGLRINMNKSKLMGISVDISKVEQAAANIECLILKTPLTYLGTRVGGLMSRIQSWNDIIESMVSRLSRWKLKTLSIGGRLTLLKLVLGVRWKNVMASKDTGGLGVSSLFALNKALMFKWVWRFISQKSSLWASVIKALHGEDSKIGIDLPSFIIPKFSNGVNTSFWDVAWHGDVAFKALVPRLYALETMKNIDVASKSSYGRHLFFSCHFISELMRKINRWWDMDYIKINSFEEWLEWVSSIRLPLKQKQIFEVSMASSSASVGSPVSDQAAYDVFLSFRGEDTRYSFTDHLFQALVRAGLRTFRDNDEIDRGRELKPEIERAIIQSRASIVVLSENYANSRWCLDELVLILDQRRNINHFVLPLFYHVNPSDVRNQRGSCAIEGSKWTEVDVSRWKEALTQVADLSGMVVSGFETDFIAKVVDTIDCKLDLKLVTLKVLGSSLRKRDNLESWTSILNSLSSLKGDLDSKIQGVLQRSFDSLPYNNDKELFLHIACFFVGEDMDYVGTILENDLKAKNGIVTLINKSLLTVSKSNQLMMHQLLQNMGRKMVCEESKDPAEHSRVWCSDEAYNLLREGDGSRKIEGLALDRQKLKEGSKSLKLQTSSLVKMKNLKLLQLQYVELVGSYEKFPKLTWLRWHWCHLKTIPSGLFMNSLIAIDMSNGELEKFEPPTKYVKPERGKALCIGGGITEKPLIFLPHSLKTLLLGYCELEYKSDVCLAQPLYKLNLEGNPFELLPNNIDLKLLRIHNLTSCPNLKSIICPSMLEELYTHWCTSLEKITFESARFRLRKFGYDGCFKLYEIQGFFKLVPIAELDEADLGHMKWIKAYKYYKIDLVGNEITIGRNWHIQMLYEYGIRSTYLQGVKDQIMMTSEYTSSSPFLSFNVPLCPGKCRIQGLNVIFTYKGSLGDDEHPWVLFVKVSNTTKGLTWIYNPVVYCKPKVDEDVVWVSYWPIGNILDAGDEINIKMVLEENLVVSGCGASLVYTNGGELRQEENLENNAKGEEVIGGDLSEFEVTTGGYYLCRRDFFESDTSYMLKMLFNDPIQYPESQGWRKSHQSIVFSGVYLDVKPLNNLHRKKLELGVSFNSESKIDKIEKEVYSLTGVEHVFLHKEIGRLIVIGDTDPIEVATCVREFEKMVVILLVSYV